MKTPECFVVATTGIPTKDMLFNGSLCHAAGGPEVVTCRGMEEAKLGVAPVRTLSAATTSRSSSCARKRTMRSCCSRHAARVSGGGTVILA